MSFFDIGRYRTDEYAKRKLQDENKLLQEEIEMRRYRERREIMTENNSTITRKNNKNDSARRTGNGDGITTPRNNPFKTN